MEVNQKAKVETSSELAEIAGDHDSPLQAPSYFLFEPHRISEMMEWKNIQRVGAGLYNLGNTCFMNSALQCLIYTPPLYNYLISRKIRPSFNPLNEMSKLALSMFSQKSSQIVSPKEIAHNLKYIGKFRLGRQEDAHEFIITLIDKMEDVIIKSYKNKLDRRVAETNPVHQVFGGYLRSQIECMESKYISNTYDPFVGISLQLDSGSTIEKCFRQYIQPDMLEGKNAYRCPLTKKLERAKKSLTIHEAPPCLILHLKRFNMFGKKIVKNITYQEQLQLDPYMSNGGRASYKLYGVLVHSGNTCHSGHYYSFVKNSNGVWYKMDDSHVSQVSLSQVLGQHAYVLFYVREDYDRLSPPPQIKKTPTKKEQQPSTPVKKEQEKNTPTIIKAEQPSTPVKKEQEKNSLSTPSKPVKSITDSPSSSLQERTPVKTPSQPFADDEEMVAPKTPTPLEEVLRRRKSIIEKRRLGFDPKLFERGVKASITGHELQSWDENADLKKQAEQLAESITKSDNSRLKRSRDLFDQSLDKGKIKRVRIKKDPEDWTNTRSKFQRAYEMKNERSKFEMETKAREDRD
ncbi:ubiquitin carboxyl-terminal hydrolase [Acrasis kona]|uniref:Ubiquitin carboxyl-terminal hydrolase n=1 Tax=Acrasis kona TaxID=1008807 RepID=A0AAW2YWL3_9EUKA